MEKKFKLVARVKSFSYAFRGIKTLVLSQHNAWIHCVATVIVVVVGLLLNLTGIEWAIIVIVMLLVWITEAVNTSIEFLCDLVSPEYNPLIEKAKDVAAGAVLISAIGSVIIGFIIFYPKLIALFNGF